MSSLSIAFPVFQGFLNTNIIEQKHIQEHMLNYYLKKQMENPAEALCYFYGCYCVGSMIVSVGMSTITGAVHGLLVTAPANDTQQSIAAPRSIADMLEAAGIFLVKRSVRCVSGAVSGAYQGARDSLGIIAAPWARLFQPLLGSDIKSQALNEASTQTNTAISQEISTQTQSSLDSLSLFSNTTEHETFSPIPSINSESTLGRWSQVSTPDTDVVNLKSESKPEDDMYTVLAQHYKSC